MPNQFAAVLRVLIVGIMLTWYSALLLLVSIAIEHFAAAECSAQAVAYNNHIDFRASQSQWRWLGKQTMLERMIREAAQSFQLLGSQDASKVASPNISLVLGYSTDRV